MKQLLLRTITGILFVVIIIGGTLWTTWSFYGLWTLIGILSLIEYNGLISNSTVFKSKSKAYQLGTLYIAIPIAIAMQIEPAMLVTILTIVWINDTGAFIVGSTIGRHPMAPSISPKKSWEGFAGGLIFAIGAALMIYIHFSNIGTDYMKIPNRLVPTLRFAGLGLVVALAAVAGDLIESKFKRTIGVKDSGTMIPGHGGMLDRFDATLLAIPVAWLYIWLFM